MPVDPSDGAARSKERQGDETPGGDEDTADARPGRVLSVNVGRPAETIWHGRTVRSAVWKAPVAGSVRARGVNLAGDAQADRRAHGGPDKALYAYGAEDPEWWSSQLGLELLGVAELAESWHRWARRMLASPR